jgi:hypothetical protein
MQRPDVFDGLQFQDHFVVDDDHDVCSVTTVDGAAVIVPWQIDLPGAGD